MESRKAQLTGGSTFTVSLPKDWANENDVEAGRELLLFPREDGSLIIEPNGDESESWQTRVAVHDVSETKLRRTLHALYTAGFDEFTIAAETELGEHRRTITTEARRFIGLEVLESTGKTVTLQSLLDSSTISVEQSAAQLQQVTLSMHEDAITALMDQDDELAEHVIERDNQVDRLFGMVSRHYQRMLQSPKETEDLGMSQSTLHDYYTTARQFERVADHAEKIADLATQFDEPPQEQFADEILAASRESRDVVEMAASAVLGDAAIGTAYEALAKRDTLADDLQTFERKLHEQDVPESHLIALVLDSLTRTAEYGGNVAEAALQSAARNEEL